MSIQEVSEGVGFPLPEKPDFGSPVQHLKAAVEWTDENLPYNQNRQVYRPELAWILGGNCYAQALGCLAILDNWDIPAGILLDNTHAQTVASTPEGVYFLDPMYHEVKKPGNESSYRGGWGLDRLYKKWLPDMLESGDFTGYFYRDHKVTGDDYWLFTSPGAIRGQSDVTPRHEAHIIVDSKQGRDMLTAIGDLKRYQHTKPHKYQEEYQDLIQFIPDFMYLPPPWHYNDS